MSRIGSGLQSYWPEQYAGSLNHSNGCPLARTYSSLILWMAACLESTCSHPSRGIFASFEKHSCWQPSELFWAKSAIAAWPSNSHFQPQKASGYSKAAIISFKNLEASYRTSYLAIGTAGRVLWEFWKHSWRSLSMVDSAGCCGASSSIESSLLECFVCCLPFLPGSSFSGYFSIVLSWNYSFSYI